MLCHFFAEADAITAINYYSVTAVYQNIHENFLWQEKWAYL